MPGYLPGNRSKPQAGQLATPAGADHDHLGGAAALAQHVSGGPADKRRVNPAGSQHRLAVRQPAGEDLLAMQPGKVGDRRLSRQFHMIWHPREADRQRRIAGPGFPGGPAECISTAGRPVIATHDPVSHSSHGNLHAYRI
jgi:hypothetical protein